MRKPFCSKQSLSRGRIFYLLGIILQEVLQGIRNPKDFVALKEYFKAFPLIDLEREDYVRAAELKNHLIEERETGKPQSTCSSLQSQFHTAAIFSRQISISPKSQSIPN